MSYTFRRLVFGLLLVVVFVPAAAFGQAAPAPATQQTAPLRRLSVDDAVKLALEQNLSLQVQRLNPQIQDLAVAQVKTVWTPTISTTISNANSTSPVSSFLSGA